ncbi:hypothetical protein PTSG_09565 [Salpingoeca rosetta]|uniref:30S ribosomal protein S6 n=1 Tax=Salpingoeca rosetta (strain ATCC 50818 / BSB-021) TaxID=946362 RepID=F2ULD1_SALR5|nr:uncharacterized protein PTSG_09565 [Salpingoeca rosetta]EGD77930.1 hypothetical protein PTSG_09565 [Salpingoeca rosetta]|eukprot:XP_004989993.1 hypothetical protein PTSG_09565 [Salpingoeca rosetta]
MPSYELCMIMRALRSEALAKELVPILQRVQSLGGVVQDVKSVGSQPLPHKMKAHFEHHDKGTYSFLRFESSPTALPQLDTALKRNSSIIRHNFVKLPALDAKPMTCRFKPKR